MRLHRLIAILLLIESRGKMRAHDLAEALETSVRSIYRDIDVLAEAGIPLVSSPGRNGGIRLMEGYTANLRQIHGEEAVQLFLTGMGMPLNGSGESGIKLKNALLKLEQTLPEAYQKDIRKARRGFYYDDTPWWQEPATLYGLDILRTAVWRSQKLKVEYRKSNGSVSERILSPYGLVFIQGDWYMVAYCETADDLRNFKCCRMIHAALTDVTFMVPESFSLKHYWQEQKHLFKQQRRAAEQYPVVLRTAAAHRAELTEYLEIMSVKQEGNFAQVTANLYSFEEACRMIFGLPGHPEVLEPPELREYVIRKIDAMQKVYAFHPMETTSTHF
ncbi:YafY family protein [Paenibacillus sp. NFR01]|uniref:helix-turn-helix transcriptional regulator n=1 Tax=Paenibacillus sp. NFR01 TaxID=1566279 RepID=UPI0008B0A4A4|nr:YafY family protein [Paenibacillus sp. NFR01]SET30847.1 Predicted DNA-binding transcriptional regulator YafY, contains an HTH and WYL domains [Paenibacillus sp. NFR01]